jgi:hypothetical protein
MQRDMWQLTESGASIRSENVKLHDIIDRQDQTILALWSMIEASEARAKGFALEPELRPTEQGLALEPELRPEERGSRLASARPEEQGLALEPELRPEERGSRLASARPEEQGE